MPRASLVTDLTIAGVSALIGWFLHSQAARIKEAEERRGDEIDSPEGVEFALIIGVGSAAAGAATRSRGLAAAGIGTAIGIAAHDIVYTRARRLEYREMPWPGWQRSAVSIRDGRMPMLTDTM